VAVIPDSTTTVLLAAEETATAWDPSTVTWTGVETEAEFATDVAMAVVAVSVSCQLGTTVEDTAVAVECAAWTPTSASAAVDTETACWAVRRASVLVTTSASAAGDAAHAAVETVTVSFKAGVPAILEAEAVPVESITTGSTPKQKLSYCAATPGTTSGEPPTPYQASTTKVYVRVNVPIATPSMQKETSACPPPRSIILIQTT
tara:strand:- start:4124 stop:4735 length:612 start_codon:yes stop_codon:yes gene_type:complete